MKEFDFYIFQNNTLQKLERKIGFFLIAFFFSIFLHFSIYAASIIPSLFAEDEYKEFDSKNIVVDFEEIPPEIPPELIAPKPTKTAPAKVEKQEWVEGKSDDKSKDPPKEEVDVNKVSGNGTDKDGYLFSFNGDKPPTPIVDFDLNDFFPSQAKAADITQKTVILMVQIDENGNLNNAKIISNKVGYGFEEAAMQVIEMLEWSPGYVKGVATKMAHTIPINFNLEN